MVIATVMNERSSQFGLDVKALRGATLLIVQSWVVGLLLCGCVGIAHTRAVAPRLELAIQSTGEVIVADIVCARFYGEPEAFVALTRQRLKADASSYEWNRVAVSGTAARTSCQSESRYIGFPLIVFVPTAPSAEIAKSRGLFMHFSGERWLYRVRMIGNSTRVERTSLDEAGSRFPAKLDEAEPALQSPDRMQRIRDRTDYYSSTNWTPTNRVVVSDLKTGDSGGILSAMLQIGNDN